MLFVVEAFLDGYATIWRGQFGGKINKNDLPSLALKRQQKNFVMSQRQLKRQIITSKCSADKSENFNLKLLNALNLTMFLAQYLSI